MRKLNYFSLLVCMFFIFISGNLFSQWPQWRGPTRDGISTDANLMKKWPADGPLLKWSVDAVGDGFSSAAIYNQVVFTQGKKDSLEVLTAIDLNGKVIWQKEIGRAMQSGEWQQSRSTPTYYKDKIYALTSLGDIACFDAMTGKTRWKMKAFENFGGNWETTAESPMLIDDKVLLTPCGYQTTMVALDYLTGKTIWRTESLSDSNYFASPVVIKGKNRNYVFQSSKLYDFIVDPNTGKIIWKENRVGGNMVSQVFRNQIYFPGDGSKGGSLCKWNEELNKRTVLWSDTIKALVISGAAIVNDKVVVSGLPRGIVCIDLNTGKLIARYNRMRTCNFLVAGNQLYCYEDGTARVYLFNVTEKGFELVSSFKTASGTGPSIAHMSISNGLLFIRHGTYLMAYNLRES
jgi:outer membrane protein assembly factor BamB